MYKSWVLTVHTGAQWWCSMKLTFPVGKNDVSIQNMLYIQHTRQTHKCSTGTKNDILPTLSAAVVSVKNAFLPSCLAVVSDWNDNLSTFPHGVLTKCTSVSNFRGGVGSTRSSVAESGSESRQKELDPKRWTQTKITASRFELKQRNFVF